MLKRLTVKNFVKFKETQTIDFGDGGAFIFVGANGSGKSSMTEALRRCSELVLNESISSKIATDEKSLAIAIFERTNQNAKTTKLVSCYVSWENKVMKVLIFYCPDMNHQNPSKVAIGCKDAQSLKWHEYDGPLLQDQLKSSIDNHYKNEESLRDIVEKLRNVYDIFHKKIVSKEKDFDQSLVTFTKTEFIFAHRGIGPIQSSDQLINATVQNTYNTAAKNAYIIKTFLEDVQGNSDKYDQKVEQEIFSLITSIKNSSFRLVDNIPIMFKGDTDDQEIPILKVSEGIVEAKYLSVMLSKKRLNTIVLEEPGRGMHKDFIDILVHRVLNKSEYTGHRLVILTTHNRDFLTPGTIQKTIFFSKNDDGSSRIDRLNTSVKRKTGHFITDDTVSSIFFSKYSIIVEGITDSIFINSLKKVLLDDNSMLDKICENTEECEMFRNFLATLNVVHIGGHKSTGKVEYICKELGIKDSRRLYLLDQDTQSTIRDDLLLDKEVSTDISSLEKMGIFLWNPNVYALPSKINKPGCLEHAMHETLKTHTEEADHKTCAIEGCTATETREGLESQGKKLLSNAESDEIVEKYVKSIVEISITYREWQIWRLIQFFKTKAQTRKGRPSKKARLK